MRFTLPASRRCWLGSPRGSEAIEPSREYVNATVFRAGANGRLSRYPLAAVGDANRGMALAIDLSTPAFCRIGYNATTSELFVAYDIALTREKPSVAVEFCCFYFPGALGFRGALAKYYELFPDAFRSRTPEQGLWMPFAKISQVQGWSDFGFRFKEGNDETTWDDEHNILTFRYTEPMIWWMSMPKETPRTLEAALAQARQLAEKGSARGQGPLHERLSRRRGPIRRPLLDTPWTNGAVWSMNSMPGIEGEVTDFKNKWSPAIREKLYGPSETATWTANTSIRARGT